MSGVRDRLAIILMVAGVLVFTVGIGIAAGIGAALVSFGGLLIALSLLVGWRI